MSLNLHVFTNIFAHEWSLMGQPVVVHKYNYLCFQYEYFPFFGEAYIAPVEGTAQGEMLIDGSMVGIGKLEEPLYVKIENGKLVEIKGRDVSKLNILLENDRNANLGELGIGTNRKARLCGMILEDEKVYGTAHIAFGTNISFGGSVKADCHLDGIILEPDLYVDDVLVATEGRIII